MRINKLVIDSTNCISDLCEIGDKWDTDKSPYNKNPNLHKHPYTGVYNLLFSSVRYQKLNIAEIGILDNKSMLCWRDYFPSARLYGYEWFDDKIENALSQNLPNTFYHKMNVQSNDSIEEGFKWANCSFDIIIEDSTHNFEDQIRVIDVAYKYMHAGSILVIEDIFRDRDEHRYEEHLINASKYFSSATFILTEHKLRYSPGWNNDQLLILHRNDVEYNNSLL